MQDQSMQLYDIYGNWFVPFWQADWFWYALYSLVGMLFFYGMYKILRWWRVPVKLTPLEYAQRRCNTLQASLDSDQKNVRMSYFMLTLILKDFLASHYDVQLEDKTDDESSVVLVSFLPQEHQHACVEFFKKVSYVKYAQQQVVSDDVVKDLEFVRTLIQSIAVS